MPDTYDPVPQTQDAEGRWVDAQPVGLSCEHGTCTNPVTLADQYERLDKNLPNDWGEESEILCAEHAVGRVRFKENA